jgi:hypothetical protein
LHETVSIAIDNHGNFVTHYISSPEKSLCERTKPIFDGYTFDSDNVVLQNSLIDLVLATNLPKIDVEDPYSDTIDEHLSENISDIKLFLKQLQITAKCI